VTATTAVSPLVITGCGAACAAGIGLDALANALGGGRRGEADLTAIGGDFPPMPLTATPEFHAEDYLGKKGIRYFDRAMRLALVACDQALAQLGTPLASTDRAHTGVVVGGTARFRSSAELCRDTLVLEKPYLVSVNGFPGTGVNYYPSQIAIRNSLRGANTAIAGGRISGLAAIRYARNAISRGHVDRAVVGAVEELCAQSAWAWYLSGALAPGAALGEGAVMFVVETPAGAAAGGRVALAELLACETGTSGRPALRQGLAACIERALRRSGVAADSVTAVSLGATGLRGLRAAEQDAVRRVLGALPPRQIRPAGVTGETFSASAALQIASLLAAWRADKGALDSAALVTSVGHDGDVGCLVLRPPHQLRQQHQEAT
jgi:3-oxoacyl-[acyl-carrier-protein] synthase II